MDNTIFTSFRNRPLAIVATALIVILGGALFSDALPISAQSRIGASQTVEGDLTNRSEESSQRLSYADRYEFTLRRTREVMIRMESPDFDAYLYLLSSEGSVIESDDDGGDGTNSEIGTTLDAGTYEIEATSWGAGVTGAFTLSLMTDASSGLEKIVDGELTYRSEESSRRSGYSDQLGFTLGGTGEVTIRMESSDFDTYLYLLSADGRVLESDDDGGDGMDSEIETTLEAGTYTIEATSWGAGATGDYTLSVVSDAIITTRVIERGEALRGELTDVSEDSGQRSSYSDRYQFTLGRRREVTIRMESSDFDTYLYLLSSDGQVLDDDDDGGDRTNSQIRTTLEAGTYTIEAASWWEGEIGGYTLSLDADALIMTGIDTGNTLRGELTSASGESSQRSSYADRYEFTLRRTREVTIRMESSDFDTYLYLLSSGGTVLRSDDDGGRGTNSEIGVTLEAGTYTIEATSWWAGMTGDFTLTLVAE